MQSFAAGVATFGLLSAAPAEQYGPDATAISNIPESPAGVSGDLSEDALEYPDGTSVEPYSTRAVSDDSQAYFPKGYDPTGYPDGIPTSAIPTPTGTEISYKLVASYESVSDTGVRARSGIVDVSYTLPDGIEFTGDPDDIPWAPSSAGIRGDGFHMDGDTLRGSVQNIPVGGSIEIELACRISSTAASEVIGGVTYYYWDGIASAQSGRQLAQSNMLRLWDSKETEPPVSEKTTVNFQYTGDVPDGLANVTAQYEPDAGIDFPVPEVYQGYEFEDWKDEFGDPVASATAAGGMMTFFGPWQLANENDVTVSYEFEDAPGILEQTGLAAIPGTTVRVGSPVQILSLEDAGVPWYAFGGWTVKEFKIGGADGSGYEIPCSGTLDTGIFKDTADDISIVYTAGWVPDTGTIEYADGDTALDSQTVTIDPTDGDVLMDAPEVPDDERKFLGWSTDPDAVTPEYGPGGSAEGILEKDGTITLYAVRRIASSIELPDAGGIGTTVFYVTGIALVLCVGSVIGIRKRRNGGGR